jgi:hypothetical protein
MSDLTNLNNLRNAFQIPESVTIAIGSVLSGVKTPFTPRLSDSFTIDNFVNQDPALYRSIQLGNPVMSDIQFLTGTYETNIVGVNKTYPSVRYSSVLLSVNQPKNLIRTKIQGRDGDVIEYIGMGNYEVTINGIITGSNGVRPIQDILDLKSVLDAPRSIDVASAYLQALNINKLVIESYTFEQQEGGYSYQTFSINAISDVSQELRLTNV